MPTLFASETQASLLKSSFRCLFLFKNKQNYGKCLKLQITALHLKLITIYFPQKSGSSRLLTMALLLFRALF